MGLGVWVLIMSSLHRALGFTSMRKNQMESEIETGVVFRGLPNRDERYREGG